jgi:hypothetical protein
MFRRDFVCRALGVPAVGVVVKGGVGAGAGGTPIDFSAITEGVAYGMQIRLGFGEHVAGVKFSRCTFTIVSSRHRFEGCSFRLCTFSFPRYGIPLQGRDLEVEDGMFAVIGSRGEPVPWRPLQGVSIGGGLVHYARGPLYFSP